MAKIPFLGKTRQAGAKPAPKKKAAKAASKKETAKAAPKKKVKAPRRKTARAPVRTEASAAAAAAPRSDPGPQSVLDGPMKPLFREAFLRRGS
jgi:hypothetical protein